MSVAASIESGTLAPDFREALRTLLSRRSKTYVEFPSTADAPGVCICTSYAELRRLIEAEYERKLKSRPTVPTDYCAGGARRKLPNGLPPTEVESKRQYEDVGTQTEASPEPVAQPGQVDSAPESQSYRIRKLQRPPVSRAICSSSSETEPVRGRRARQASSHSLSGLST